MAFYSKRKGYPKGGHHDKAEDERFVVPEQIRAMLEAAERNPRDHALVYLTYHLGLRVGEVVLLERSHFRLLDKGEVMVPTLKQRSNLVCPECGQRVQRSKKLKQVTCRNCKHVMRNPVVAPMEQKLPYVEKQTVQYLKKYLAGLPARQRWLFVRQGPVRERISSRWARSILWSYAKRCGLTEAFSPHALRHGRGVFLWNQLKDLKGVSAFLRHKQMATSEIYVHLSPERRRQLAEKLERAREQDDGE